MATEKQYFAALYGSDEITVKREFEYPFLVLLDEPAKKYYHELSSLEKRKRYIELYWNMANPNPLLPENEWLSEFIDRFKFVKNNFSYTETTLFR